MAYLLILTGSRATELVELNPAATLTVGSGAHAHIQLPEAEVAELHCQVYPAEGLYWLQDLGQGHTLLNLAPLSNQIYALYPFDVVVIGRTYLQFHVERPASAKTPELEAPEASAPLAEARAEAIRAGQAAEELRVELGAARASLTKAEASAERHREALEGAQADATRANETVERLRDELAQATASIDKLTEEARGRERELKDAVKLAEKRSTQLEQLKNERVELAEMAQGRAQQLEEARLELERAAASGDERLVTLTRDLAEARERLATSAAALVALGAQPASDELPRSSPDEVVALLEEAGLPPDVAAAVEAKLVTLVDREVVRRFAGAAPDFERSASPEIDRELRALRARAARLAAAVLEEPSGVA